MYYPVDKRELTIITQIKNTLLIFFVLLFTFPGVLLAKKDIKEEIAQDYRLKGYEAQQKGDLDSAITFYIKAAELGIADAASYNDIGVIYEQLEIEDKAESNYLKALSLNNEYLPVYSNLAYFYKKNGNLPKAAEYFRKRLSKGNPEDYWTQKAKEELYLLSDKLPHIKRWIIQHEAMVLNKELVIKAQQEFYNKIMRSQGYFKQGEILEKEENYREALRAYNQSLSITPENPKVLRARESVLLKMTKADVEKRTDMAMKMLELGDTVSAKMEFKKILSIIPNEPIQISE